MKPIKAANVRDPLNQIRDIIAHMDAWGVRETPMPPKTLALFANQLEIAADSLAKFGLGHSWPTIKASKKRASDKLGHIHQSKRERTT